VDARSDQTLHAKPGLPAVASLTDQDHIRTGTSIEPSKSLRSFTPIPATLITSDGKPGAIVPSTEVSTSGVLRLRALTRLYLQR
jgi:hypothetical protein